MPASKVYFADMRAGEDENLPQKLERLARQAGIADIDFKNKFTAVKIHFGEAGNLSYLRPNYARVVVDLVRALGGRPFLTDCNTLYVGGRRHALDHLDTAYANGFFPLAVNSHVVIADGLKGNDETLVPVPHGAHVKEAKIGRAVMDADVFISLNHFKGHECTGFGGALKNIGMGCGSRAGKMEQHSAGKPDVNADACIACRKCAKACGADAISFPQRTARIDHRRCVGCGRCLGVCPADAIDPAYDAANDALNRKMAEYAWAVLDGRPHFHISLAIDLSPFCDCHGYNDAPFAPDVGMLASFDPVALDVACADLVNRQPACPGTVMDDGRSKGRDHFATVSPDTDWRVGIDHAVKLGLGSKEYELVRLGDKSQRR